MTILAIAPRRLEVLQRVASEISAIAVFGERAGSQSLAPVADIIGPEATARLRSLAAELMREVYPVISPETISSRSIE